MSLADERRDYHVASLRRADLDPDPIAQFKRWIEQVQGVRAGGKLRRFLIRVYKAFLLPGGSGPVDFSAMTLATVDADGRPSARTVLLKGVDERGFLFFTNYDSRKGRELAQNPNAALVFYWADLERQVCVAGEVSKLPESESEAYFNSRPIMSRVAAIASRQSTPIKDRAELEARFDETANQHHGDKGTRPKRPAHWGGYALNPRRMEFWQGRPSRLHDRFSYTRMPDGQWQIERLMP